MQRILFIISILLSFVQLLSHIEVDITNHNIEIIQHQNAVNETILDSTSQTDNLENKSKIYNQKVEIPVDHLNNKKVNALSFRFILSGILIMLTSIAMFLRLWTYKNAQRIEEGKLQYNLPELIGETFFSFNILWMLPVRNDYKNDKAKKMDHFSQIMLYSLYAGIILFTINLITL